MKQRVKGFVNMLTLSPEDSFEYCKMKVNSGFEHHSLKVNLYQPGRKEQSKKGIRLSS
jgi:hypothetical protein